MATSTVGTTFPVKLSQILSGAGAELDAVDPFFNTSYRATGLKIVCKLTFHNLVPWALSGDVKAEVADLLYLC